MAETKTATVKLSEMDYTIHTIHVKQNPYVDEDGIWVPVNEYVPEGYASTYRCVMTKEMFVGAYNMYINKSKRMYKGGWKRK